MKKGKRKKKDEEKSNENWNKTPTRLILPQKIRSKSQLSCKMMSFPKKRKESTDLNKLLDTIVTELMRAQHTLL